MCKLYFIIFDVHFRRFFYCICILLHMMCGFVLHFFFIITFYDVILLLMCILEESVVVFCILLIL